LRAAQVDDRRVTSAEPCSSTRFEARERSILVLQTGLPDFRLNEQTGETRHDLKNPKALGRRSFKAGTSAPAILRRRKHVLPAFVFNIRERFCG
jgi:hypothetical protein